MLEVLPPCDAAFYALEANVLDTAGKSQIIFEEMEGHYCFIGGNEHKRVSYLLRDDLPLGMWTWDVRRNVRAVVRVSAVLKKCGVKQRKLLMQAASNYLWTDPSLRGDVGLHGGGALSRLYDTDRIAVAAVDQNNAFARVVFPRMDAALVRRAPARAFNVWGKLPEWVRSGVSQGGWVYPLYGRLAMVSSHSVFILMAINLFQAGRV
jgi:hypothetical protein